MPDTAASYTLPQLVGFGVAAEMTLTGRMYGAAWARRRAWSMTLYLTIG